MARTRRRRRQRFCDVAYPRSAERGSRTFQETEVAPYGDLEWVEESWFPAMRNTIVRSLDRDDLDESAEVVKRRLREVEEGTVIPNSSEEVHRKILQNMAERRQTRFEN